MSDRLSNVPAHAIEAWHLLNLSDARHEALRIVEQNPGHTARELERITGHRKLNARLAELKRMGLVEEEQVRYCTVSNRHASQWRAIPGAIPPIPVRYEMFSAKDLTTLDYRLILPSAAADFELNYDDERVGKADFSFSPQDYARNNRTCAGDEQVFIPERVVLTPAQQKQVATLKRRSTFFCKKAGFEIAELATYLARRGVGLRDLHRGNFGMKKNGEWVIRDMGTSQKYGDTPAPELQGLYFANFKGLR